MTEAQTENSKRPFNLAKLAEKIGAGAEPVDENDNVRLKKFFRPTIFNLTDMQENSTVTS